MATTGRSRATGSTPTSSSTTTRPRSSPAPTSSWTGRSRRCSSRSRRGRSRCRRRRPGQAGAEAALRPGAQAMSLESVNPATGRRIRSYREHTAGEIGSRLARSCEAFRTWRGTTFAQRSRALRRVAAVLRQRAGGLARLATDEMGKPLCEAAAEVRKCTLACEYYARHARSLLAQEHPPGSPRTARVVFEPMGPILAVMPWNFPFWQVFRAAAPALMAGNTMLLKHASNVTGCARAIEAAFVEAGLPRGVF